MNAFKRQSNSPITDRTLSARKKLITFRNAGLHKRMGNTRKGNCVSGQLRYFSYCVHFIE